MEEGLALLYNSANPLPLQKLLAIDKEENKEATSSPRVDLGNDLSRDSQQFHTSNSTSQFEVSAKFSLSDLDQNIEVLFTLFLRQDRACWREKTFSSFSNEDLGKFSPGIAARYPSPVIKHLCRFTTTITNLHIDIFAGLLLVPSVGDN